MNRALCIWRKLGYQTEGNTRRNFLKLWKATTSSTSATICTSDRWWYPVIPFQIMLALYQHCISSVSFITGLHTEIQATIYPSDNRRMGGTEEETWAICKAYWEEGTKRGRNDTGHPSSSGKTQRRSERDSWVPWQVQSHNCNSCK